MAVNFPNESIVGISHPPAVGEIAFAYPYVNFFYAYGGYNVSYTPQMGFGIFDQEGRQLINGVFEFVPLPEQSATLLLCAFGFISLLLFRYIWRIQSSPTL